MASLSTKAKLIMAILAVGVGLVWLNSRVRGPEVRGTPENSAAAEGRDRTGRRHAERGQRLDAERTGDEDVMQHVGRQRARRDARAARRRVAEPPQSATAQEVSPDDRAEFERLRDIVLHDSDPEQRAQAVWQITNFEDVPVVPVLHQALLDSDREVRLTAVQELSGLDDVASPGEETRWDLIALALDDQDPEVRLEALNVVDEAADEEGQRDRVRALIDKALSDPDEDVRSKAEDMLDSDSGDD